MSVISPTVEGHIELSQLWKKQVQLQLPCWREIRDGSRGLPAPPSHAYVGSARGHEAVFADALVRAGSVHTASVFTRTDPDSRLAALINVYTASAGVV